MYHTVRMAHLKSLLKGLELDFAEVEQIIVAAIKERQIKVRLCFLSFLPFKFTRAHHPPSLLPPHSPLTTHHICMHTRTHRCEWTIRGSACTLAKRGWRATPPCGSSSR